MYILTHHISYLLIASFYTVRSVDHDKVLICNLTVFRIVCQCPALRLYNNVSTDVCVANEATVTALALFVIYF